MITIATEHCNGCGLCAKTCPFTVLELNQNGVMQNTGKSCIACMHCAAICPNQAITFDGKRAVSMSVNQISMECIDTTERLIYQRRSYRRFRKEPVSHRLLERALGAAMIAPSAKNQHPTRWIILEDLKTQARLMEEILQYCSRQQTSLEIPAEVARQNNPVMGQNATLLIGYCAENAINPSQDTAIALTTAELILQASGIGTCWGGYLTRFLNQIPACRDILEIPQNHHVYGSLMLGYPDQPPFRAVPKRLHCPDIQWK